MLPRAFDYTILTVKIATTTVLMTGIKWTGDENDEDGGGSGGLMMSDFPLTFCHHLGHMTECKSSQFYLHERSSPSRELVVMCKARNTYFKFLKSSHSTERLAKIFAYFM